MTDSLAAYHRGHSAATSAALAAGPRRRDAISHRQSPAWTRTPPARDLRAEPTGGSDGRGADARSGGSVGAGWTCGAGWRFGPVWVFGPVWGFGSDRVGELRDRAGPPLEGQIGAGTDAALGAA